MTGLPVVGSIAAWITAWLVIYLVFRSRAVRIENSLASVPDKVHRLQRLMMLGVGLLFAALLTPGFIVAVQSSGSEPHRSHSGSSALTGLMAVLVVVPLMLLPVIALSRAVRPSIARLRGIPLKNPERKRQAAAGAVVGLGYGLILVAGGVLVPRHGTGQAIGTAALYVVALVVLSAVVVPLAMVAIATQPMPPARAQRLNELATEIGVHVRGFRVLKGRARKVANAAQIGTLPWLRFVIVTDYLMDHLDKEELDAVVAHELGHARRHHLLKKLAILLIGWGMLVGVATWVAHTVAHGHEAWVLTVAAVALPVGLVLVQGLVGVRMEEEADDVAARTVGARLFAAALDELGELNHTKRDTSRAWSVLTQHPGLERRVERLRVLSNSPVPEQRQQT